MVHTDIDRLGAVIKSARKAKGLTREQLAETINISPRYLMSIENKNRKPRYNILFKLIRELNVSADTIFYPEMAASADPEIESLTRQLHRCDQYGIKVVAATVNALLNK